MIITQEKNIKKQKLKNKTNIDVYINNPTYYIETIPDLA